MNNIITKTTLCSNIAKQSSEFNINVPQYYRKNKNENNNKVVVDDKDKDKDKNQHDIVAYCNLINASNNNVWIDSIWY